MPAPEMSVIIPCHGRSQDLHHQLRALAEQVDPPSFEVVLCDNATVPRLDERDFSEVARGLSIRVVRADGHPGAAYARNRGMAETDAPLLGFVDDDDLVHPQWVRRAVTALRHFEVVSGGVVTRTSTELAELTFEQRRQLLIAETGPAPAVPARDGSMGPALMGGNFVVRRETLLRVGGFDAALSRGAEDNDLGFRLAQTGITVMDYGAMSILYRLPAPGWSRLRKNYRAGAALAHAVAARNAWNASDEFRSSPAVELARGLGSLSKMGLGLSPRDLEGAAGRVAVAAGLTAGWTRHRLIRRVPPTHIGLGLGDLS